MAGVSNEWTAWALLVAALVAAAGRSLAAEPAASVCDVNGTCISNLRVERLLDTAGAVIDSVPTRHYWYRTAYTLHEHGAANGREIEIFEVEWAASSLVGHESGGQAAASARHGRVIDDLIARTQKRFKAGRPVRHSEFVVVREIPNGDAASRAAVCSTEGG